MKQEKEAFLVCFPNSVAGVSVLQVVGRTNTKEAAQEVATQWGGAFIIPTTYYH